ncbi:hypothetical protein V5O48_005293 [Marasmius crinis-equi]|uniref:Uncharacterized protein n=1 Tax=Marasmius crinis-equi TaxID=585013 RepID=A0ABR3FNN1_9AGAR
MNDSEIRISRQIEEDWDSYEGAPAKICPLESPLSVDDILSFSLGVQKILIPAQQGFDDVLSSSDEDLSNLFRSWKAAVESKTKETPHLLAFHLEGDYRRLPAPSELIRSDLDSEAHMRVSTLDEIDRRILAKLAPYAKVYDFEMHLAQYRYEREGYIDVGDVDLEECSDYDPGEPDEANFKPHEVEGELTLDHIFSLDGIPMTLSGDCDIPDKFINGTEMDGYCESELDWWDFGPGLKRTWTGRVLLLSPKGSTHAVITIQLYRLEWMCSELYEPSLRPSGKDRKLVEVLLEQIFMKMNQNSEDSTKATVAPSIASSEWSDCRMIAERLADCAVEWRDLLLLNRLLEACTKDPIHIIGVGKFISMYEVFGGDMKGVLSHILKTESSHELQVKLVKGLQVVARVSQDTVITSWCDEQLDPVFGRLSRLESATVDLIVEHAKSQPSPSLALQNLVRAKFLPVKYSDAEMWRVLFGRLSAERESKLSSFDDAVLQQLILHCLQQVSVELTPYAEMKGPSVSTRQVKHILTFVELCLEHNAIGVPEIFFRRMQKEAKAYHPAGHAYEYYSDLLVQLDGLVKEKPEARKVLSTFFSDALSEILRRPNSHRCGTATQLDLPLAIACLHLHDPNEVFGEWFTLDKQKISRSQPGQSQKHVLSMAKTYVQILLGQTRPQLLNGCYNILKPAIEAKIDNFHHNVNSLTTLDDREATLCIVELYFTMENTDWSSLMSKLFQKILGPSKHNYVKNGLVPFMEELEELLRRNGRSVLEEPFAGFLAEAKLKQDQPRKKRAFHGNGNRREGNSKRRRVR